VNTERWQEVERVFHAALEQPAEDRDAWLARACGEDEDLRGEVQSLLQYQVRAERFIESPALDLAANMQASPRAAAATAGQAIQQYRILSVIGAGGAGEVYLADDTRLHRRVALKLLALHLARDRAHLRRFEREARAIAALSHPNVCVIHEVLETAEGQQCIVMEYVEGVTLRDHLARGRMHLAAALDVAIQVASALSAAHAAGIVHRDIKPENIVLRSDGYVKVLDFGLAKLTEPRGVDAQAPPETDVSTAAGGVMGTIRYMSPEQSRGLSVDRRTDLWSLGVVLYEMVAGQQPFTGAAVTDVLIAISERDPAPLAPFAPDVRARFDEIVKKALQKNREERYPSANDLLADLKKLKRELELAASDGVQPGSTAVLPSPPADSEVTTVHVLLQANRELPLEEGENIVGRDSAARLRFKSGAVSRRHAAILVEGACATIVDLGSKNGTFVDGERIVEPRLLRDGMTLRFGTKELVYRRGRAEPETDSLE
jgi:serine/threonine protein kinase